MSETRTIAVGTHGRYLVQAPRLDNTVPLLVGFHGYGELAGRCDGFRPSCSDATMPTTVTPLPMGTRPYALDRRWSRSVGGAWVLFDRDSPRTVSHRRSTRYSAKHN